jgi:hypothetical protein
MADGKWLYSPPCHGQVVVLAGMFYKTTVNTPIQIQFTACKRHTNCYPQAKTILNIHSYPKQLCPNRIPWCGIRGYGVGGMLRTM